MIKPYPHYLSFLLRLWAEDSNFTIEWRASLENPATGERKGFADVDALARFLKSLTDEIKSIGEKYEQTARDLFDP